MPGERGGHKGLKLKSNLVHWGSKIGPIIDRQRETIMASSTDDQSFGLTEEILTNAGTKLQAEIDHWIGRANSDNSNRLSEQHDRVISSAKLKRHSLVLDLYLGTGFFTSELFQSFF